VSPADIPAVKELLTFTWLDTYGELLSPETIETATTIWHDPKMLAQQAHDPNFIFIVYEESGTVLGLLTMRILDAHTVFLNRLYVHPAHQRTGIGSHLLQAALAECEGAQKVVLEVEEKNAKGAAFYRKHGFSEKEQKVEKVGTEEIAVIVMENSNC
jgi:ribosomal protein S18 acetylase RimI-like enzyme